MTNDETRMTNQIPMTEAPMSLVIRYSSLIRHSDFVIRHFHPIRVFKSTFRPGVGAAL
jgi:hypothetical protein